MTSLSYGAGIVNAAADDFLFQTVGFNIGAGIMF